MAKDKQSPEKTTPVKAATKKSPAKKAAAKAGKKAAAPVPSTGPATPTREQLSKEISKRAYEIYCGRGAQHGAHEDDWLQAEKEIRAKYKI